MKWRKWKDLSKESKIWFIVSMLSVLVAWAITWIVPSDKVLMNAWDARFFVPLLGLLLFIVNFGIPKEENHK